MLQNADRYRIVIGWEGYQLGSSPPIVGTNLYAIPLQDLFDEIPRNKHKGQYPKVTVECKDPTDVTLISKHTGEVIDKRNCLVVVSVELRYSGIECHAIWVNDSYVR